MFINWTATDLNGVSSVAIQLTFTHSEFWVRLARENRFKYLSWDEIKWVAICPPSQILIHARLRCNTHSATSNTPVLNEWDLRYLKCLFAKSNGERCMEWNLVWKKVQGVHSAINDTNVINVIHNKYLFSLMSFKSFIWLFLFRTQTKIFFLCSGCRLFS